MTNPRNTSEHLRATWSDRYVTSDRGCHEWSGARNGNGYGRVQWNGKRSRAHRVAYELFVGSIPEGQVVRHRCDNPSCVNPDHLELGTQGDNMRDMQERDRGRGPCVLTGPDWPIFLRRLNELGLSKSRLATKFGVSRDAITKAIRRAPKGKIQNTRRINSGNHALPGVHWPIFLRRLNELGLSHHRLAEKFGVTRNTIAMTINRAPRGTKESTRRTCQGNQALPGRDWPVFLRKLNELGLTYTRLAQKFGVSRQTIKRTINR